MEQEKKKYIGTREPEVRQNEQEENLKLVRAINAGDNLAFEKFYELYKEDIRWLARNDEDIFQSMWYAIVRNLRNYDETKGASIKTFIMNNAKYARLSHYFLGTKKHEKNVSFNDLVSLGEANFSGEESSLEERYELKEKCDDLKKNLRRINKRERMALEMTYIDGKHEKDVAEALGVPVARLHRIRLMGMRKIRMFTERDAKQFEDAQERENL